MFRKMFSSFITTKPQLSINYGYWFNRVILKKNHNNMFIFYPFKKQILKDYKPRKI